MRRDKPEFPAAIETAYPKWETFLALLRELEETYADRNFYKLKSESLEASLEKEKQAHMETVGAYHDADEELARLIKVAREK